MPPKRRNNTGITPIFPNHIAPKLNVNGPITRRMQSLKNEECVVRETSLMENSPTSEFNSSESSNLNFQTQGNIAADLPSNAVKSRNKFSHTEIYCNSNQGDQRVMNRFEYTNFSDQSNGINLNGHLLYTDNNYATPMIPMSSFPSSVENNLNAEINPRIDESFDANESNVYHTKSIKYVAEFLLMTYFISSFIFTTRFNHLKLSIEPEGEHHTVTFTSIEEAMMCKVLWCTIFGCLTDFISWRIAFYIQSLMWSLFLASIYIQSFQTYYRFFGLLCLSSSPVLISSIGVAKIWGGDKWSLLSWIRLYIFSYVFPLCFKIGASRSWQRMIGERIPSAGVAYVYDSFGKLGETLCSACVLIAGCAICLMLIPALTNDSRPPSLNQGAVVVSGGGPSTGALSWFVRLVFLKVLLYAPSSLWLKFYSRNSVDVEDTIAMLIPLSVVIHCCVVPLCLRVTSHRSALILSTLLLCLTYGFASYHSSWCSSSSFSVATLVLCSVSSSFHTTFESPPALRVQRSAGVTFCALACLHFGIQFLTERFYVSHDSRFQASSHPEKIAFFTVFESYYGLFKGYFNSYLCSMQSGLYAFYVFLVYSLSKPGMNMEVLLASSHSIKSVSEDFIEGREASEKICGLEESPETSIEFISLIGIIFSAVALVILILSHK